MTTTEQSTEQSARARARAHGARNGDGSVGELVSAVATDAQTLFHQEMELAKAEMRQEMSKAGQAAGMYGGAGFAAYMVAILLTLAGVAGLANVMDPAWAALIGAGAWLLIGAVMYAVGRYRMKSVSPRPDQTMQTLKENARWARHHGS